MLGGQAGDEAGTARDIENALGWAQRSRVDQTAHPRLHHQPHVPFVKLRRVPAELPTFSRAHVRRLSASDIPGHEHHVHRLAVDHHSTPTAPLMAKPDLLVQSNRACVVRKGLQLEASDSVVARPADEFIEKRSANSSPSVSSRDRHRQGAAVTHLRPGMAMEIEHAYDQPVLFREEKRRVRFHANLFGAHPPNDKLRSEWGAAMLEQKIN